MPFASLYRRIVQALDRESLSGMAARAMRRESSADAPRQPASPHPFDLAHHVETSGFVAGEKLAKGPYHTAYCAIAPSAMTQALDHVGATGIDWSRFTFVDIGCGKGRALLLASRHPFRAIVGVEQSAELCEIARGNVAAFQAPWRQSAPFEIVHGDAAKFDFPETPLLVFLYHPFLVPVLRKVLYNLWRSVARIPREVYLLYASPDYEKEIAKYPYLEKQWHYRLPLSAEDAAASLFPTAEERFSLYRHRGLSWHEEPMSPGA